MSAAASQARAALDAIRILGPARYAWFGTPSDALPPQTEAMMAPADARAYLAYSIAGRLYADFYTVGTARPIGLDATMGYVAASLTPFVQSLSTANTGTGAREGGWRVVSAEEDALVVQRPDGLRFRAQPGEVAAADGALAAGAAVAVLMPKELLRLSPGFYMALGDAELPPASAGSLVRLYWNIRADGAAPLVHLLTAALNDAAVPFRLKVVADPSRYARCDAGVLYVARADYAAVRPAAETAYARLAAALGPAVPALTKQLAPGLSLAEDPAGGMASYGQSRCGLLAEAAIRAAERGVTDSDGRLAVARGCFAEAGLDLDAPYLEPGSADAYPFGA
jgi:hypothetical protein